MLAFDLASGDLARRLELPPDGAAHSLGDIALGPDGTIVLSDAQSGELWRLRPEGKSLELLVPRNVLVSPQGLAIPPEGKHSAVVIWREVLDRNKRRSCRSLRANRVG